jgi:hypothetical protein
MSRTIKIAGLDMTMSNLGAARFLYDIDTGAVTLDDAFLITTERNDRKLVRANSDDLRRSQEIKAGVDRISAGCAFICAEVPSGSQSAGAAKSFGVALGILASLPSEKLIQVMPTETKLASVGGKTAKKPEIIAWAAASYPQAPWLTYEKRTKNHAAGDLHEDNEHMADACAVIHAGLRTDEFKRAISILKRDQ